MSNPRTHQKPSLLHDEQAAVASIGTITMTGLAVALMVGSAMVAAEVQEQFNEDTLEAPQFAVQSRSDGERHEVSLSMGRLSLDAKIHIRSDGDSTALALSWWADQGYLDDEWGVGEWLCVSGPDPDCATPYSDAVSLSVHPASGGGKILGEVEHKAIQEEDIVKVASKRSPFYIDPTGAIVLQDANIVHMTIVGTEITWGSTGPDVPVTVKASKNGGDDYYEPFNGPVQAGMTHNMGVLQKGDHIGVEATAAIYSWSKTRDSFADSPFVHSVRHGDSIPSAPAFNGQVPITDLIAPYTDGTFIVLDDNEIMLLFELGTDNLGSAAADFQDLVVIFSVDPPQSTATSSVFQRLCFSEVTFDVAPDEAEHWYASGAVPGGCDPTASITNREYAFQVSWQVYTQAGGTLGDAMRLNMDAIDADDVLEAQICRHASEGPGVAYTDWVAMAIVPMLTQNGHNAFGPCSLLDFSDWMPGGSLHDFFGSLGLPNQEADLASAADELAAALSGPGDSTDPITDPVTDPVEETLDPKGNKGLAKGKNK